MAKVKSHGLGFGKGSIIEHPDGVIEYRQTGKLAPAFRVRIEDITGFAVRKPTRDDKKSGASGMQQMFVLLGHGTELAAVAVNVGTSQKIEDWIRARPDFGSAQAPASSSATSAATSLTDELGKLAQLHESGVLTDEQFEQAKMRLLEA